MRRFILSVATCLFLNSAAAQSVVNVAAAANVRDAIEQIRQLYQQEREGVVVNVTYGASGVLMQQIVHGAAFGLFLSADEEFARRLWADGYALGEPLPYARGKLALYSRTIDLTQSGLESLSAAEVRRIAVANPTVATYGTRAVELLKERGLYESLSKKLIFGANISAAAQYVFSGNAEVGFVALSQIVSPGAQVDGFSYIIPTDYYRPIVQGCVAIKGASDEVLLFRDFLLSERAKEIWRGYGYE